MASFSHKEMKCFEEYLYFFQKGIKKAWNNKNGRLTLTDFKNLKYFIYIQLHVSRMLLLIPVLQFTPILCSIETFSCVYLCLCVQNTLETRGRPEVPRWHSILSLFTEPEAVFQPRWLFLPTLLDFKHKKDLNSNSYSNHSYPLSPV